MSEVFDETMQMVDHGQVELAEDIEEPDWDAYISRFHARCDAWWEACDLRDAYNETDNEELRIAIKAYLKWVFSNQEYQGFDMKKRGMVIGAEFRQTRKRHQKNDEDHKANMAEEMARYMAKHLEK